MAETIACVAAHVVARAGDLESSSGPYSRGWSPPEDYRGRLEDDDALVRER
jgi:hypothetical protein